MADEVIIEEFVVIAERYPQPVTQVVLSGERGLRGFAGGTILSGSGSPDDLVGEDGDWYLDEDTNDFWGAKADGSWPASPAVNLKGDQGDAGQDSFIIESNQNGSGYWYTFRDNAGNEIFTIQRFPASSSSGGAVTVYFPVSFTNTNFQLVGTQSNQTVIGIVSCNIVSTSAFQLRCVDGFNRPLNRYCSFIAVGKIDP